MMGKEKVLDDIARIAGGFVSVVNDLGNNIRADLRSRTDEFATRLDLVPREDFERLESILENALKKIDQQNDRLVALEKKQKK